MSQDSTKKILEDRGDSYNRHGNFHTLANLTQTLEKIIIQHYVAVRAQEGSPPPQMPNFMAESLHMICQKIARICNGDETYVDSWQDIAGYSQLVVDILVDHEERQKKQEQVRAEQEARIMEKKAAAEEVVEAEIVEP